MGREPHVSKEGHINEERDVHVERRVVQVGNGERRGAPRVHL